MVGGVEEGERVRYKDAIPRDLLQLQVKNYILVTSSSTLTHPYPGLLLPLKAGGSRQGLPSLEILPQHIQLVGGALVSILAEQQV
jgi:hypothetical protein